MNFLYSHQKEKSFICSVRVHQLLEYEDRILLLRIGYFLMLILLPRSNQSLWRKTQNLALSTSLLHVALDHDIQLRLQVFRCLCSQKGFEAVSKLAFVLNLHTRSKVIESISEVVSLIDSS